MKAWRNKTSQQLKAAWLARNKHERTVPAGLGRKLAKLGTIQLKAVPSPLFMRMLVHAGWAHVIEQEPLNVAKPPALPPELENYDGPLAFDTETRAPYSPWSAGVGPAPVL